MLVLAVNLKLPYITYKFESGSTYANEFGASNENHRKA